MIFKTLSVKCGRGANMRAKFNVARIITTYMNVQMMANFKKEDVMQYQIKHFNQPTSNFHVNSLERVLP